MEIIVDGNKACSLASYLFSELAFVYPITPSSPMANNVDKLAIRNKKNIFNNKVKVIQMQSEGGAIGALHGALLSGTLATTYTSSQGLLLMIPNMYKIAGECLPCVIHVASRTIATHALSIFNDHSDIYATRQTGFCILASTNVTDAYYLACVAHLASIKISLPFIHFFDGFRTSHEMNKIDIIDEKKLTDLFDYRSLDKYQEKTLKIDNNITRGTNQNEDIYFQTIEARNTLYIDAANIVNDMMIKINKLTNSNYQPFNYYGSKNASLIIIAMGSVCDTIKIVLDDLQDESLGLVEVHLYRPFSQEYLLKALPKSVKRIAVLDRTKEPGSIGEPLYLDVLSSLKNKDIKIVGGRYGISSKDTTPSLIYSVYQMLKNTLKDNFTIGINDDVTNLSLNNYDYYIDLKLKEIKIYGHASDGMVSASKDIITIMGKEQYVQCYNQYDSLKSGGITISNIRYGYNKINAPYYIEKPSMVVVSKEEYFYNIDVIKGLKKDGLLIINTSINNINKILSNKDKKYIIDNNIKVIIIDADMIANKYNIKGKISKIIEVIILKYLNVDNVLDIITSSIKEQFKDKGNDIIESNINACIDALNSYIEYNNQFIYNSKESNIPSNIFSKISNMEGNSLSVKDMLEYKDGTFKQNGYISNLKKSKYVAHVIDDKCIKCGICSLVCPHSVIRLFKIDNKEKVYVLEEQCRECGICIKACPKQAIEYKEFDEESNKKSLKIFNSNDNDYISKDQIKDIELIKPRFAFSSACNGCGETSYIKLLTKLFKDNLIIANATGCSSIYGGCITANPYSIPWANSLFEDNAEFGYGMLLSYENKRNSLINYLNKNMSKFDNNIKSLCTKWLNNKDDYIITKNIKEELSKLNIDKTLRSLLDYIPYHTVWSIGGDGWAYDIGFGGIDHVLSSNKRVRILVLDTETYSNTGGQMSKSSHIGDVKEFANLGKTTNKKDLFKMAMNYPNCYVASVSMGANMLKTIEAFKEAEKNNGPSIIIAYSPCVLHGIKGGMINALEEQKKAVECGYLLLMRFKDGKLYIDSKEPDFSKYHDFLINEVRYNSLYNKDKKLADELLSLNIINAKERLEYYKKIAEMNN